MIEDNTYRISVVVSILIELLNALSPSADGRVFSDHQWFVQTVRTGRDLYAFMICQVLFINT